MRAAISTIAWADPFDVRVLGELRELGIDALELAPTMIWPDLVTATPDEVERARGQFNGAGMDVVSMQALLYGRADLNLFDDDPEPMLAHMGLVCRIGGALGATALVFGSPRNRLRGELSLPSAMAKAADVFGRAAEVAQAEGTTLVLEPNPEHYGADFATTAQQATHLVRRVEHPGFRLHLDTACLRLAGTDISTAVYDGADVLAHFHVSEPDLAAVPGDGDTDHAGAAAALHDVGYDGHVAIEMRRQDDPEDAQAAIRAAVNFVQTTYLEPA